MSMLNKSRHWLAPLSAFLICSPAVMATTASQPPVEISNKAVNLTADDLGDIHLRISHKAMTGPPSHLKDALLEVIHNDETHRSKPAHVDPEGKAHYLVRLGQDEADTEIQLKPISATTPLADVASMLATGLSTLLTLKIADVGYSHATGNGFLPFGPQATDNFAQDIARNYTRQSLLLSTLGIGETISNTTNELIGKNTSGRTTWKDAVPDVTTSLVMGLPAWLLHDGSRPWYTAQNWSSHVSLFHTSSTTNTLSRSLRKLNEAAANDLFDLDQTTISRGSQAATIIQGALVLAALDGLNIARPGAAGGNSWLKSVLSNSAAVTLTYNVRDLAAELSTDFVGDGSLGEFLSGGLMATGASALQVWGGWRGNPLNMTDMTYHSTIAFIAAEAAGASLGLGLQKLVNNMMDDENSSKARAARVGSAALLGIALKGIAAQFGAGAINNVLGPMGDGVIIINTMDAMTLVKDNVIEPWVVTPLMKATGWITEKDTPAVRLKTQALRRPLLDV